MKDKNYLKYLQDSPTYYGYGGHKFLFGGLGQKLGNVVSSVVGQMKSTENNPVTSMLAQAGIGASSGLGGLGGSINNMIINPLGKLMNPNGNTTGAGKVMNAVGNVASMIPGVGGVVGAAVNHLGNIVNAAFGSNLNKEFIRETEADAQDTRGFSSVAGTNEALAKDFSWQDTVTKDQVGTEGWFSDKAKNETQRLNDLIMEANAMKTNQLGARSATIQENQTRNALMNNFDFGGYLAAEGGGIHIKKKNRGKFTAAAKRAGMGVQEYARHVLANKDRYSSTLVKRANFARNFGGHKKAYGGYEDLFFNEIPNQNDLFLYTPIGYEVQDNPPKYVRSTFRNDNDIKSTLLKDLWDIHNSTKDISQRGAGILIQALNRPQGYEGLITRANEIHPIDSLFQVNEPQKALEELVKRKIGRHGMNVDMFEPTYLYNDGVIERMRNVHNAYIANKASEKLAAALMSINYDETLTDDINDLYNYQKTQRATAKGDNRVINYGLFSNENIRPTTKQERLKGEQRNYVEDPKMWYGQYKKYLNDNKIKDSEDAQAKFYFQKYLPAKGYTLEELNKQEDLAELVRMLYKAQGGKYTAKKLQNAIDRANFLYKSTYSKGGKLNNEETMRQQDNVKRNANIFLRDLANSIYLKEPRQRPFRINPLEYGFLTLNDLSNEYYPLSQYSPERLELAEVPQVTNIQKSAPTKLPKSKDTLKEIPRPSLDEVYTIEVEAGDTLSELARDYGISMADLADYNNIKDVNKIYVGQKLKVPTKKVIRKEVPIMKNPVHSDIIPLAEFEPLNSSYYNPMFGSSSRHINLRALGGGLDQDNNGVNTVNTGGTHEQNPYEGVQMGIAPDGQPNLVEEDEVIWNDYVFSNRLNIPKEMKEHYKYKHKTFADEAKDAQKESEERPNDPISMNGLEAAMGRLQAVQEFTRQQEDIKNRGRRFDDGGRFVFDARKYSYDPDYYYGVSPALMPRYIPIDGFNTWENRRIERDPKQFPVYSYQDFEIVPGDWGTTRGLGKALEGFNNAHSTHNSSLLTDHLWLPIDTSTKDSTIYNNPSVESTPESTTSRTTIEEPIENTSSRDAEERYRINRSITPMTANETLLSPLTTEDTSTYKRSLGDPEVGEEDIVLLDEPTSSSGTDRKGINLLRLAPVIDSGIQTIVDQFSSPDYSLARDISNARRQIRDVGFTPMGGHMGYTPYDRSYLLNKINQQNAATNRAIVNNSGGNAAAAQAGLIAANYNQTNALGDALMRMDQMNEQRKMAIAQHNAEIDQYNSQGQMKADATNRELDLQRANLAVQAAQAREAIRAREEARRTANRNAFITNLGALGSEMEQRDWLNELIDSGAIRAASGYCKGGKLRKKKGGKHA